MSKIIQNILLTVDIVIFTVVKEKLCIVLIERLLDPYKNARALPGGFVLDDESTDQAAIRELKEETNIENHYLEQLYTFADVDRDPRGRVASVGYFALVNSDEININPGTDAKSVKFFEINEIPELAFDHKKILEYAYQRLKRKLEYTNLIHYLLPDEFTLGQMQSTYQTILQKKLDKRNFRKKILTTGMIKETGKKEQNVPHRPSELYKFSKKDTKIVSLV